MVTWGELEREAPDLAAKGKRLLYRTGNGEALISTVRGDAPPRIHPIAVAVVDGALYAFILRSPKLVDLEQDGRFALHAYPDAAIPHEFAIRGRVRAVAGERRSALARGWSFDVGDSPAFELLIQEAVLGERDSREAWPPSYTTWPKHDPSSNGVPAEQ